MALIRWEPARELQALQQEVNRLFGAAFDSGTVGNGEIPSRRWIPAMDLVEEEEHLVLRADLPGVEADSINVELQDNVLTIFGERAPEHQGQEGGYQLLERAWGAFSRSLTLPEGVDPESVQASFKNGVLEVRVPKPEERKPRRVAINVGDKPPVIDSPSR